MYDNLLTEQPLARDHLFEESPETFAGLRKVNKSAQQINRMVMARSVSPLLVESMENLPKGGKRPPSHLKKPKTLKTNNSKNIKSI